MGVGGAAVVLIWMGFRRERIPRNAQSYHKEHCLRVHVSKGVLFMLAYIVQIAVPKRLQDECLPTVRPKTQRQHESPVGSNTKTRYFAVYIDTHLAYTLRRNTQWLSIYFSLSSAKKQRTKIKTRTHQSWRILYNRQDITECSQRALPYIVKQTH